MPMCRIIRLPGLALLLALASCGTSPDPGFYNLAVVPGTSVTEIHATIKIAQPDLPAFLDRPDFVSQSSPYQININETANWAEPLASMFERILAEDLRQRLPLAVIETDADDENPSTPRLIVETRIQQFNPIEHDQIVLRGDWQLTDLKTQMQPKNASIAVTINNGSHDPAAIAADLSALLGQYADQVVAGVAAVSISAAE